MPIFKLNDILKPAISENRRNDKDATLMLKKFFTSFDEMFTPKFILFFFWFLIFCDALSSLALLFHGLDAYGIASKMMGIILALIFFVVAAVMDRVFCEILIVVFKIHEDLHLIHDVITDIRASDLQVTSKTI